MAAIDLCPLDIRVSCVLAVPLHEAWRVARAWGSAQWLQWPLRGPVLVDGLNGSSATDVGAFRVVRMGGAELYEQLVALDDFEHKLRYKLISHPQNSSPFGASFANYVASLEMRRVTVGDTTFGEWRGTFLTEPHNARHMREVIELTYLKSFRQLEVVVAQGLKQTLAGLTAGMAPACPPPAKLVTPAHPAQPVQPAVPALPAERPLFSRPSPRMVGSMPLVPEVAEPALPVMPAPAQGPWPGMSMHSVPRPVLQQLQQLQQPAPGVQGQARQSPLSAFMSQQNTPYSAPKSHLPPAAAAASAASRLGAGQAAAMRLRPRFSEASRGSSFGECEASRTLHSEQTSPMSVHRKSSSFNTDLLPAGLLNGQPTAAGPDELAYCSDSGGITGISSGGGGGGSGGVWRRASADATLAPQAATGSWPPKLAEAVVLQPATPAAVVVGVPLPSSDSSGSPPGSSDEECGVIPPPPPPPRRCSFEEAAKRLEERSRRLHKAPARTSAHPAGMSPFASPFSPFASPFGAAAPAAVNSGSSSSSVDS